MMFLSYPRACVYCCALCAAVVSKRLDEVKGTFERLKEPLEASGAEVKFPTR